VNTIDRCRSLQAFPLPPVRTSRLVALGALAGTLLASGVAIADEAPAPTEAAPPAAETPPAAEAAPPAEAPPPPVPAAPAPAETTTVSKVAAPPTPVTPPAPPPPPYSLPWQMRPLTVGNVVRSDTSVAFYKDAMGNTGSSQASMLLASYKLTPEIAPIIRLGWVKNDAPAMGADGSSFVNPIVAAAYSHKLDSFRLAGFLGTTIPIGQGAGQMPNAGAAAANAAGINARSAMDNAMFAVNYMTAIAGVGFGYVSNGFTAQVEATLFQLFRVRGNDLTGSAPDSTRTNSTAGLHLGYFIIPQLSVGGELRYQRWLSTPNRLVMGAKTPFADANLDNVTFAVGPRGHFKLSKTMWLRPGISYSQGLDKPLSDSKYHMVQVDIPFVF
jgi:hypothetical protein